MCGLLNVYAFVFIFVGYRRKIMLSNCKRYFLSKETYSVITTNLFLMTTVLCIRNIVHNRYI